MSVLLFIVVLLLLIVGHELGHFTAAKLSKMRVDEFGVGFPPRIFGKKIGETEYTVNWLPFGGFVRIFGEDENGGADPRAFNNRPALLQAGTLFAGPFANIVMAFFLSSFAFMVGTPALIDSEIELQRATDVSVLIGEVLANSPAEGAGIAPGDRITSIETNQGVFSVTDPDQVSNIISNSEGTITLSLLRGAEVVHLSMEPAIGVLENMPEERVIGIATAQVGTVSYPIHLAFWRGLQDTGRDFVFILVSLISLIGSALSLSADVSSVAGPVGIASLTGDAAAFGLGSLLSFAALLSINLGIINLLPFPALDGGRLLFLGIETLTRKKIPTAVAQTVNAGGFFVLIALMIAVTIGDISKLLG